MRGCWVRGRKPCMAEQLVTQRAGPVVTLIDAAFMQDRHDQIDEVPQALWRYDAAQLDLVEPDPVELLLYPRPALRFRALAASLPASSSPLGWSADDRKSQCGMWWNKRGQRPIMPVAIR